MITAHRERHAMARDDLVAIIDHRNFRNLANSENETLRRIYDSGETVDTHTAEVRDGERATLKLLRLHPLVARAMRQILGQLANLTKRFVLRGANDRGQ